ncbi:MAG: hypothetical protein CR217_07090 [Beijerinckiaceae bacterium]|nr:MAG: hypothetical protein CR217_07090 [Beijerinckiaceae bacterium]
MMHISEEIYAHIKTLSAIILCYCPFEYIFQFDPRPVGQFSRPVNHLYSFCRSPAVGAAKRRARAGVAWLTGMLAGPKAWAEVRHGGP